MRRFNITYWTITVILTVWLIIVLSSCEQKPEVYIDGKPFVTEKVCIQSHIQLVPITHIIGKVPVTSLHPMPICDAYRIDTLEFKAE